MNVFFVLSGEHATLPRAEVLSVLESSGIEYKILDGLDRILIVKAKGLNGVCGRLALTHKICEFLGVCDPYMEEILRLVNGSNIELQDRFASRVIRINTYSPGIKTDELESKIGWLLKNKTGAKVDLDNPLNTVYGFLSSKFVLGRGLLDINRSQYEKRKPHLRPYFYPGSLSPRIARAIVNLSRVREGERLIDPFCGSGGILIEAGLVGARVYGCDVEADHVQGCKINLRHFNITDFMLEVRDARRLSEDYKDYFDAIVTDPPYGISASTKGLKLRELYREALESFQEILRPERFACILGPKDLELEELAKDAGFEIVEKHHERVHRSLTRKIVVVKKA